MKMVTGKALHSSGKGYFWRSDEHSNFQGEQKRTVLEQDQSVSLQTILLPRDGRVGLSQRYSVTYSFQRNPSDKCHPPSHPPHHTHSSIIIRQSEAQVIFREIHFYKARYYYP